MMSLSCGSAILPTLWLLRVFTEQWKCGVVRVFVIRDGNTAATFGIKSATCRAMFIACQGTTIAYRRAAVVTYRSTSIVAYFGTRNMTCGDITAVVACCSNPIVARQGAASIACRRSTIVTCYTAVVAACSTTTAACSRILAINFSGDKAARATVPLAAIARDDRRSSGNRLKRTVALGKRLTLALDGVGASGCRHGRRERECDLEGDYDGGEEIGDVHSQSNWECRCGRVMGWISRE